MLKEDNLAAEITGVVGDVMSKQFVSVQPKVSAADAAEQMLMAGVRHAIVINMDRHVLGVVSQRDIFTHFMQSSDEQESTEETATDCAPWEIGSLIRRSPLTVTPDAQLGKAALVLSNYKIDLLPVVDVDRQLIGTLTVAEVLKHITGSMDSDLDHEFTFFKPEKQSRPQKPAFFRRANGALVLPQSCLEDPSSPPGFAVLGYEPSTGRIIVKFTTTPESGARKVIKENESLVMPASDFVAHFDIKFHGAAFEITMPRQSGMLILTPKQPAAVRPGAPAPAEAKK